MSTQAIPIETCYEVDPETGCWNWKRKIASNGYGRVKRDRREQAAHRYMYELLIGPIPSGMQIDHLCCNRACVNPNHLEPVTGQENRRRGSGTKLTVEIASDIKALHRAGMSYAQIGRKFGILRGHARAIYLGRIWSDAL